MGTNTMKIPFTLFLANLSLAFSQGLIELAEEAGDFSTLLAGLDAADLTGALREPNGPYTVLAPTDDAFAALPEGLLECLVKPENKAVLTDILTYHVANEIFRSTDIFDGFTETMLNGDELTIPFYEEGEPTVDGITFGDADVEAS